MTGTSWRVYRETIGDRAGLFAAVAAFTGARHVLYPGSYVDVSPSTAFDRVTYVDLDRRADRYFRQGLEAERALLLPGARVTFLPADYRQQLDVALGSVDLLVSLYAPGVWDHCAGYLRPDGWFLANASHGDASLAGLDHRLDLVAVARHRDGRYRLAADDLQDYLVPTRPEAAEPEAIRASGRGIAYTRSAFAYLFQLRRAGDSRSP